METVLYNKRMIRCVGIKENLDGFMECLLAQYNSRSI